MYDTLYYRSNLSNKQLSEIATYFKTCLMDGSDSVHDVAMMKNFLDGISKGHRNLVYAVERMKVVGICLYACAPTSLGKYKHVDISSLPAKIFLHTYSLTASANWHKVIYRIESIVDPYRKSIAPLGRILELKDSRELCKAAGDYYINEFGRPYVLCGDGNFVLLNKEKENDKDQLQRKENSGSGCSEGRIIYGRRDEFKYSTGRHCDQASAKGQEGGARRYQVVLSPRSPKVLQYKM